MGETRTGEIDESLRDDATVGDYVSKAKWWAMCEGAAILRPDLVDATDAYRHFLWGGGADYHFDYDRFLDNDSAGRQVEASVTEDIYDQALDEYGTQRHVEGQQDSDGPVSFTIQNDRGALQVGSDARFPYPGTENWQKAIGGHSIWVEANVRGAPLSDGGEHILTVDMTIHMEDRYNFNPFQADIESGIKDAENGRLSVVGLGQEFMQYGESRRVFTVVDELYGERSGAPLVTQRPDQDQEGSGSGDRG